MPKKPIIADAEKYRRVFESLWVLNLLRGMDGSGMYAVPRKEQESVRFAKYPYPVPMVLGTKPVNSILTQVENFWALVGHTRLATRGNPSLANTHPFNNKHITLVHNGLVVGGNGLLGSLDFECDSEWACNLLANHDADHVISRLTGAFTLVWHDKNEDAIKVVRNKERPLHWAQTVDGVTLFASEWPMLQFVRDRFDLKFQNAEKWGGIFEIAEYDLTSFSSDGEVNIKNIKKVVEYPPRNPPWTGSHGGKKSYSAHGWNKAQETDTIHAGKVAIPYLEKVNIKLGSKVRFTGTFLELPQAKSRSGTLSGYMSGMDGLLIEVPGVSGKKYDTNEFFYTATVVGVKVSQDGAITIIGEQLHRSGVPIDETFKGSKEPTVIVTGMDSSWKSWKEYREWFAGVKHVAAEVSTDAAGKDYVQLGGIWISQENADLMAEEGCCACQKVIVKKDYKDSSINGASILCPSCTTSYSLDGIVH
jgi:hypothetical protein